MRRREGDTCNMVAYCANYQPLSVPEVTGIKTIERCRDGCAKNHRNYIIFYLI